MELPITKQGRVHNKGSFLYLFKNRNFPLLSLREPLSPINSLDVRAGGCLITLGYFLISLLSRILPPYVAEGSKGASHGGELLSAPRNFYNAVNLQQNELDNTVFINIGTPIMYQLYSGMI